MKLNKIAYISSGLLLSRKKSSTDEGFKYKLLTLKSFNEDGYMEVNLLDDFIGEEKIKEQYLTREGDIIVRLSAPNTAVYVKKDQEGIVIPSLFVVIRNKCEKINSKFLAIYLNSHQCKRQLAGDTIGSVLSIVKTSSFKDIEVPVYSKEKQDNIVKIDELVIKEKKLLTKLLSEKQRYHKVIMNEMFK